MNQNEVKKLRRKELLELLVAQAEKIDQLEYLNGQLNEQLEQKKIAIAQSGSIAEAALQLQNIFRQAQAAADLYVENVKMQSEKLGDEG